MIQKEELPVLVSSVSSTSESRCASVSKIEKDRLVNSSAYTGCGFRFGRWFLSNTLI